MTTVTKYLLLLHLSWISTGTALHVLWKTVALQTFFFFALFSSVRCMGFILMIFSCVEFQRYTVTHARIKPIDAPARPLPGLTCSALLQTRNCYCTSDFQALLLVVASMFELAAQSRSFNWKHRMLSYRNLGPCHALIIFVRHTFFGWGSYLASTVVLRNQCLLQDLHGKKLEAGIAFWQSALTRKSHKLVSFLEVSHAVLKFVSYPILN